MYSDQTFVLQHHYSLSATENLINLLLKRAFISVPEIKLEPIAPLLMQFIDVPLTRYILLVTSGMKISAL